MKFLKRVKKAVEVRLRYLAGDPNLKPRTLDLLHTERQFDRIYLEDPHWWWKWPREPHISRDFMMKKYLGQ